MKKKRKSSYDKVFEIFNMKWDEYTLGITLAQIFCKVSIQYVKNKNDQFIKTLSFNNNCKNLLQRFKNDNTYSRHIVKSLIALINNLTMIKTEDRFPIDYSIHLLNVSLANIKK